MKHEMSKERLEQVANFHRTMSLPPSHDEIEAMARALLAAHEQEPFMYGISDPDGKAHIDEYCVCAEPAPLEDSVNELNYDREEDDELNYTVVPLYTRPASSIPTVSFYRDGIAAAAAWVDAQREAYDNEHGRHDPDTGTFEFGNDAQLEYSSTLVEIAEGIRALHPNASSALSIPAAVPEGWKLVPVIADADMSHAGHMYYQQSKRDTGDFTPTGMFSAMIKASPAAPAPAVPDEIDIKQAYQYMRSNSLAGCYRDGWNDRDAMLRNSPVIPDGYVLVPVDATRAMIDAARRVEEDGYDAMHKAMIAAAPKAPDGWIPVSERLPDNDIYVSVVSRHGEYVSGLVNGEWLDLHDCSSFPVSEIYLWLILPSLPSKSLPGAPKVTQ